MKTSSSSDSDGSKAESAEPTTAVSRLSPFPDIVVTVGATDQQYAGEVFADIADSMAHRVDLRRLVATGYHRYDDMIGEIAEGGVEMSPITLSETLVFVNPFGMFVDAISGPDNSRLAVQLARSGQIMGLSSLLRNEQFIRDVVTGLLPGVKERPVRSDTDMTTFNQLLTVVSESMSKHDSTGRGNALFVLAVADMMRVFVAPMIKVAEAKPIRMHRMVWGLIPSKRDVRMAIVADKIKVALDQCATFNTESSGVNSAVPAVIAGKVIEKASLLGRTLIEIAECAHWLDIVVDIVAWRLRATSLGGFPAEMRDNVHLVALMQNATVVEWACEAAPATLPSRMSLWEKALSSTHAAITGGSIVRNVPFSTYAEWFGHSIMEGTQRTPLGLRLYMNLPGSAAPFIYLPDASNKRAGIGEMIVSPAQSAMIAGLYGKINALDTLIAIRYTVNATHEMLASAYTVDSTSFQEQVFVQRLLVGEQEALHYAYALTRNVIPTLLPDGQLRLDMIVPITNQVSPLVGYSYAGALRVSSYIPVLLLSEPRASVAQLPTAPDVVTPEDRKGLVVLDSVHATRSFHDTPIDWLFQLGSAGDARLVAPSLVEAMQLESIEGFVTASTHRTFAIMFMLTSVLADLRGRLPVDKLFVLAEAQGEIIMRFMGGQPELKRLKLRLFRAFLQSCTTSGRRDIMQTEFARAETDLVVTTGLALQLMVIANLLSKKAAGQWADDLANASWYSRLSLANAVPDYQLSA